MSLPGVTQSELDNQIGTVPVGDGDVCLVIGCSSSGTNATLKAYAGNRQGDLVTDYGYGPGPQAISRQLVKGRRAVFCKVAIATAGDSGTVTITSAGTASTPTADGGNDRRHVKVEFLSAGALGTAGITFRYSLDGGATWSTVIRLGTSLTYLIPNTGTTITFGTSSQTVLATTRLEFRTTAPTWDLTTLGAAFDAVKVSSIPWDFIHIVGDCSKTFLDGVKTELADLMSTLRKKTAIFLDARGYDYADSETEAEWITSLNTDFETASSSRLCVGAGDLRIYSPIDRTLSLRPVTWSAVERAVTTDSARYELGRVRSGPLDAALFDSSGNPLGHNEERTPGLDTTGVGGTARFMTARTHAPKGKGAYITRANMMSDPGSDFYSWRMRRAMDIACNETLRILTDEVQETPGVNANGTISEDYAKAVESAVNTALEVKLEKTGRVSRAYCVVNRTDIVSTTKTIRVKTRLRANPTVDFIEEEIAYENPALLSDADEEEV